MDPFVNRMVGVLLLVAVGFSTQGCSQESGSGGTDVAAEEHDPEAELLQEVCEHMAEGPSRVVTAAAYDGADAPAVGTPHTRFDVDLVPVAGGPHGGDVLYPVSDAGMLWVALSVEVPLTVTRLSDGQVLIPTEEIPADDLPCREVVRVVAVPVDVGTVRLRLGQTSMTQVSLVLESGDHEHQE